MRAPDQVKGLLPTGPPRVGQAWDVREDLATAILTRFYPQTENNDVLTHRFERRELARILHTKCEEYSCAAA